MVSRRAGASSSRSWTLGLPKRATVSPSTPRAATVQPKPTGCCRRTAAVGARSLKSGAMSTNREIIVVGDGKAIAETAALRLIKRLNDAKDRAAVCLTGGSSPEGLYRLLADEPWCGKVPWDRVHWFMGDDRFVPENDPRSNMGIARRLFLDKAGAPPANIHAMPTDANDPEGAANIYQDTLKGFYGAEQLDPARPLFDLVLMGVGPDGHCASLYPG